jgi:signal transduction histidine kinase
LQQPTQALIEAYREVDKSVRLRYVRISIVLFLLLMPSFSALDWIVYPELFDEMFKIRLFFNGLFLGILVITFTRLAVHIEVIGVGAAIAAGFSISWMVAISEGAASPYYAGLNLILVVMAVLLPWTLRETGVVCAATTAIYVGACWWHGGDMLVSQEQLAVFTNNLFFLAATSIICMTASYFQSIRRFEEFRLRYELDGQNKKLEALDREKTDFFANVSHELRTPLTLILAPVEELLSSAAALSDRVAVRLGVVRDNSLRLLKLVNDLLDVIRLEEGKEALDCKAVDANVLLGGIVEGMIHLADTKNIALQADLCAGALVIAADRRALEKIGVNLLNNSIKFTDKGGRITLDTVRENGWGVLRVTDTGIGIPIEAQAHIFDRFHQVDASSTRRYRGTGLGLALVKELTEKMGGTVEVQSAVGQGTTMTVRLPVAPEGVEADPEASGAAEDDCLEQLHRLAERRGGLTLEDPEPGWVGEEGGSYDSRPTVLVVEDEPDMRRYLADILEEEYRVLTARTGTQGLRMAREQAPELVLLDLMLPEMDGLEVCRRIREDANLRSQKIMLLTARVDEQSKLTALEHGADDFLTKPFSSLEIRTRLRNLLATAVLERDLEERNRRLQKALGELEATQAQLIHSEKLNALGSLAAGLLHEINNPLNYSLTALQLIREDPAVKENDLLAEVVTDIDEGMQRIRSIVGDLRAFAYPSEAEKRTHFALREAVDSALRFTSHELKGLKVLDEVPEGLRVLGSRSHITQVLVNLLSNAVRSVSPERPLEVRLGAVRSGSRVTVRVSDNGVGMDGETLRRAFDPFFTTRDVGEGMGLGLSICHTIVSNHGGRLLAHSQVGIGSELVFDLPAEASPAGD